MSPLVEEVALVTGASSGIGAATAMELARHGAKLILTARRVERLHQVERAIRQSGGEAISIAADLTDPGQASHIVKESEAQFGRIDILINNAGVFWARSFDTTPPADLIELVQVNLLGAMLTTRAALPGMLERHHGAVINISSVSGRVAMEPIYSATKYGLRGFSLALRRQVSGSGVNVSCIEPGNIRTDMTRHVPGRLPGPEVVADQICGLVRRPRREVVVPGTRYPIVWLEQIFPALADVAYHRRHWSPVR